MPKTLQANKKKNEQRKTGGGPPPPDFIPAEELALSNNEGRPLMVGVEGATLSPRRQVNRAFSNPKVISILTLVLAWTTLNLVCGPSSGSGYGVIRKGRQA
ncbi:hypothetical protein NQZ68_031071 [Dissostichus eleginoides]|nr:hypothetical protein NQZ68_031071 [Dissostichus eleginoides]